MQHPIGRSRLGVSIALSAISGFLCLAFCAFYLWALLEFGLPTESLRSLAILSRLLAFPFFLVSVGGLRLACMLLWGDCILVWALDIASSSGPFTLSPFSSRGSTIQIAAACLLTIAYSLVAKMGDGVDSTGRKPSIRSMIRIYDRNSN